MGRKVYVLTLTDRGPDMELATTVEGVYSSCQAALDAVARDYDDEEDRFLSAAADPDEWEEESPVCLCFSSPELGPTPTWRVWAEGVEEGHPTCATCDGHGVVFDASLDEDPPCPDCRAHEVRAERPTLIDIGISPEEELEASRGVTGDTVYEPEE